MNIEVSNLFLQKIHSFIDYMAAKEVSKSTLIGYDSDLKSFMLFIQTKGKCNVDEVGLEDLHSYMAHLNGKAKTTKARHVSSLKSFWAYLVKMKAVKENITLELERPKLDRRQPIYMGIEESMQLLTATINDERDYCILVLFLNCGLRISEMAGLKLSDIRDNQMLVHGKGNKERIVPLNALCETALKTYLIGRPEVADNHVFLSRLGRGMTTRAIRDIVHKHVKEAGLDEKYTPHKLRHSAATLMFKHGKVDIRTLQTILGHDNINTTTIYTHMNNETMTNETMTNAVNSNPLNQMLKEKKDDKQ